MVSVLGEAFVTIGVAMLLFVAWQMWIGDWIIGAQNNAAGQSLSQQWAHSRAPASPAPTEPSPSDSPNAAPAPSDAPIPQDVPIPAEPANAQVFGIMHIPRFGSDYAVKMAGGVTRPGTLDPIGIGHYPGTPMPGSVGNVALAAHRTTFGKPFNKIATLHVGDAIVIETPGGWYTYRFRTLEYVTPQSVDVLDAVPQASAVADGRYLTMTSCSPMYSKTERIVAYSVFDSFTPRADGPPASLAAVD